MQAYGKIQAEQHLNVWLTVCHTDGLKTDLEGRVEKDGWLSKPSALSNVGVRTIESF